MALGFISPFYHTVGEWVGLRSVLVLVCLELSLDGTSMVYGDGVVWGSVKGGDGGGGRGIRYGTVLCCASSEKTGRRLWWVWFLEAVVGSVLSYMLGLVPAVKGVIIYSAVLVGWLIG